MGAYDNIQYGSRSVNGQLIPVIEWAALASGNAVGPQFGGGPASPATIPPNGSGGGMRNSMASVNGSAAAQPFSFKNSPVPLLIIMLIVGMLGLRYVHWRR